MDDGYITHVAWTMKELKTEIAINESMIRTIEEIQELWRAGVLTDREFIEILERIGW